MEYKQLSQQYKDDVIAANLYHRECEHHNHQVSRSNYEKMLETLPEGPYRDLIKGHLATTCERMAEVEAVHAALETQIVDPDAHAAAVARVQEKREAFEAAQLSMAAVKR